MFLGKIAFLMFFYLYLLSYYQNLNPLMNNLLFFEHFI